MLSEKTQIVLYLPGGYILHLENPWTTGTASWPPYPTFVPLSSPSYWNRLSIIITVTSHMSLFNHSQTVSTRDLKFSLIFFDLWKLFIDHRHKFIQCVYI